MELRARCEIEENAEHLTMIFTTPMKFYISFFFLLFLSILMSILTIVILLDPYTGGDPKGVFWFLISIFLVWSPTTPLIENFKMRRTNLELDKKQRTIRIQSTGLINQSQKYHIDDFYSFHVKNRKKYTFNFFYIALYYKDEELIPSTPFYPGSSSIYGSLDVLNDKLNSVLQILKTNQ